MSTRSRWQPDDGEASSTTTPLPRSTNVAVVGGGVIGVACAYALAKRGLAVAVLEADRLAARASGRNGGFVVASAAERRRLRAVLAREAIECGYRETGHLALASSAGVLDRFRDADAPDGRVEVLDRAACEDLLRLRFAARFAGGRWQPDAAQIDPYQLVLGLARAAERHGAELVTGCEVRGLAAGDDGTIDLVTSCGHVEATHVVVACGLDTERLATAVAGLLRPVRGQMLATVAGAQQRFRAGMAVDFGSVYWRQEPNGSLTIGGCRSADPETETTDRDALNPLVQDALERFLPDAFEGLKCPPVQRRWTGIMDETVDGAPLLGRASQDANLWVAAGFGGHGLPPALAAGEALARAIADGSLPDGLGRLSPTRFGEVAA